MDLYFAFSGLFNAIASTLLGILVFLKNPKNKVNQTFTLFCLAVAVWSYAYIGWPLAKTAEDTLFWFQLLHIGACFTSIAYFHFVVSWLGLYEKKKKAVLFGYLLAAFFSSFVFSKLFIADIVPKFSMRFWAEPGIVYHFYLLYFFSFAAWSSVLLYKNYKTSYGIRREQIKYILIGISLSFIGGSTNYFLWYNINIPPYGNILGASFVIFSAYAIIRYRLMDIRIVARKIFVYIGAAGFTYGAFYFIFWAYSRAFGSVTNSASYAAGLVIAPAFVFCFYFIDRRLRVFANRHLFVSLYNYQDTIAKLTNELNRYIDLNKIINLIVGTIQKTMQLDRAGVLLINAETNPVSFEIAKVMGFNRQNGISLVKDNFLTRYLEKTQKPLVRDELTLLSRDAKNSGDREAIERLHGHMKKIEASLCLPLMSNKKLIGIIVLGAKLSGDAYTAEDLELLNTLSKQAGTAIENARLYKRVGDFNVTLKNKVDEQTKDIVAKNEELEKKTWSLEKQTQELEGNNAYMKKLLAMRSEFLDIASHQLRTPVSVIKGMLSMILEGGMPKDKVDEFMRASFKKSCKLSEIINDILRASEIDSEKVLLKFTEVDLNKFLGKIFEDKQIQSKNTGVALSLKLPDNPLPRLKVDERYLGQAIENLMNNSLQYTPKGGRVELSAGLKEDKLEIRIADTGIGIPREDRPKLFKKFSRAKNAVNMFTDGTGLGLYIVKRIVEGHDGGRVMIEKTAVNKGTTFLITLATRHQVPALAGASHSGVAAL